MKLSAIILSVIVGLAPVKNYKTIVTKIHEDDQISILTSYKGSVREKMLHGYDFNVPVQLAEEIPVQKAVGKFINSYQEMETKYFTFESYDKNVMWVLDESEIGFTPNLETEYILLYCDNGTDGNNQSYDDIFIEVFEAESEFLDLSTVVGFDATETGVLLHTNDGNGYYIEK